MSKYQSYIICTSPRSGSTLLCKLLSATGIAGNPGSYFYDASLEGWLAYFGMSQDGRSSEIETLKAVFQAAAAKGTGTTGMFGLRMQRPSFPFFMEKLAILHPGYSTGKDRIESAFGTTAYIHLTRQDKVEQAVSWVMAEQTGLWHRNADGSELERLAPPAPPAYDALRLGEKVEKVTAFDQDWTAWFESEAIAPLKITYEDLAADPGAVLGGVLTALGLDGSAALGIEPPVAKLSDATNHAWAERFRREMETV